MQVFRARAHASGWLLACLVAIASCSSTSESNDTNLGAGATGGSAGGARSSGAESSGGGLRIDDTSSNAGGAEGEQVSASDACAKSSEPTRAQPAVLELVVDTSGSMDWPPGWAPSTPNDSKPPGATKWEITRDALAHAVAALPDDVALGAVFYPNVEQEDEVCLREEVALPVAVLGPVSSAVRAQFSRALAGVVPVGATPTHGAYRFGLSKLSASTLPGDRFVLLITDGTPTCDIECTCTEDNVAVDPLPLVREAAAARVDGVRTFVIGSPGSEGARDVLSRLASEGGTAKSSCSDSGPRFCHFDMSTEPDLASGLAAALAEVTSRVRSCSYPIPDPPQGEALDPELVNVIFTPGGSPDGETIARAPDGEDCQGGWQYASDGRAVVLCPDTCARAQADAASQVEILFGCQTVVQTPR